MAKAIDPTHIANTLRVQMQINKHRRKNVCALVTQCTAHAIDTAMRPNKQTNARTAAKGQDALSLLTETATRRNAKHETAPHAQFDVR